MTMRWLMLCGLLAVPSMGCVMLGMGAHQLLYSKETLKEGVDAASIHGAAVLDGVASPNTRDSRFDNECSIAVTFSGGGSISAAFSYGVVRELAALRPDVAAGHLRNPLWQIDYFSTASGGGITAALVEVLMREVERERPADWDEALTRKLDALTNLETFSETFISHLGLALGPGQPALQRFRDQLPIAVFGENHRCGAGHPVLTVGEAFPQSTSVFPIWVPNATAFWDGRRVPLTPPVLKILANGGTLEPVGTALPCGSVLGRGVDQWLMTDLLAASMSFPGIGPYRLMSKRDGKSLNFDLVDGGISDNLATGTAFDLLQFDPAANRPGVGRGSPRRLLIVVDASSDQDRGIYTGNPLPSAEDYLGELGNIFIAAQYPEAHRWAEESSRALGVDLVWLRLQDFAQEDTIVRCPDLASRESPWTKVGQTDCPNRQPQSAVKFVNTLSTSADIPPDLANGLMQLGRLVTHRRGDLVEKLQRCLTPPSRQAGVPGARVVSQSKE